jgi:translation initiation factor 2 gamma subunit (eIF-2gamma)
MIHLGVSVAKIIYVFNKVDLVRPEEAMEKYQQLGILSEGNKNYVMISSKTGMNVDVLLDVVKSRIYVNLKKVDKN